MTDNSGTHLYLVLMKAHRTMARHAHRSIAAHDLLAEPGVAPVDEVGVDIVRVAVNHIQPVAAEIGHDTRRRGVRRLGALSGWGQRASIRVDHVPVD